MMRQQGAAAVARAVKRASSSSCSVFTRVCVRRQQHAVVAQAARRLSVVSSAPPSLPSSHRNARAAKSSASFSTAPAATPSVKDLLIKITVVDPSGARRKISGFIGKTLYEACDMQGINLGPVSMGAPPEVKRTESWTEPTFGEGITSGFDHVVLVGKAMQVAAENAPATSVEQQMIEDHWDYDEIYEGSRLASAVTLTKEMDGMIVYVPDRIVDDIP